MNSTELLESIRQRSYAPVSTATGSDDTTLLNLINEELRSGLGPYLMKVREDYFLRSKDYTVQSGVTSYRIPKRAIAANIKSIVRIDLNGDEQEEINRLTVEDNVNAGYRIENANIILVNEPVDVGESIRVRYYSRPNKVVLMTSVAKITAMAAPAVNCDLVPAGWTNTDSFDIQKPNLVFELVLDENTPSAVVTGIGGSLTFSGGASVLDDTELGDYVCKTGESGFPQIPEDLHPLLAQRVAVTWLEQAGSGEDFRRAKDKLEKMEHELIGIISARADGEKIIYNPYGLVSHASRRW